MMSAGQIAKGTWAVRVGCLVRHSAPPLGPLLETQPEIRSDDCLCSSAAHLLKGIVDTSGAPGSHQPGRGCYRATRVAERAADQRRSAGAEFGDGADCCVQVLVSRWHEVEHGDVRIAPD